MQKIIATILMILLLASCTGKKRFSKDSIFAPMPARMGTPNKDAPADYKEGWADGCETGLSTMNQLYYKHFYGYKQNTKKISNKLYYQAWKDAYTYCRQYSFRYSWNALDQASNGGILSMKPLCILCPTYR